MVNDNLNLTPGTHIFVPCKDEVWLEAFVENVTEKTVTVKLLGDKDGEIREYKTTDTFYPQSVDIDGNDEVPDDLTKLTHLHEASILHSLHWRFKRDKIYSLTGNILIAVNPFKTIPNLYSNQMLMRFDYVGDKDPHVFSTASDAYYGMLDGNCQSILISGESGAGKTESTKYVLKYLCSHLIRKPVNLNSYYLNSPESRRTPRGARTPMSQSEAMEYSYAEEAIKQMKDNVEMKVLESNPLLESFGNASTLRNHNSSRYGKYIELQYVQKTSDRLQLIGATIQTYLLEKVRIAQQQQGERNYHVFHQLVAANRKYGNEYTFVTSNNETWHIDLSHFQGNFRIVPDCKPIGNYDENYDLSFFNENLMAMDTLGLNADEVNVIFSVVATVLHLTNIEFVINAQCSEGAVVSNLDDNILKIAELLQVEESDLLNVLLTRSIKTVNEFYTKPKRIDEAVDTRDAIAKNIYSILFDFVVNVANSAVDPKQSEVDVSAGILDIFGFECFQINSFEQLCINFTNETLQNFFNNCVFKYEQQLYTDEGISWNPLDFPDNQDCIDLFKAKISGIFAMIDEECHIPGGTDQTLCNKMVQKHTGNKRFDKVRTDQTCFIINHFAGGVKYKVDGFLEKNKDQLSDDSLHFITNVKNKEIKQIFESLIKSNQNLTQLMKKRKTISTQFTNQLDVLMNKIGKTEPHFIRCIKPNQFNKPNIFERLSVNEQLKCGGMLQVVEVSRAGYPVRLTHAVFYNKFKYLLSGQERKNVLIHQPDIRKMSKMLLDTVIEREMSHDPYKEGSLAFGKTLIFFKNNVYELLFNSLQMLRNESAVIIQKNYRCYRQRKLYTEWMRRIRTLQIYLKYKIRKIREYRRKCLWAALTVQSTYRMLKTRAEYRRKLDKWVRLQSLFRSMASRKESREKYINSSATVIQSYFKMYVQRRYYRQMKRSVLKLQVNWRSVLAKRQFKRLQQEAKSLGTMIEKNQLLQEELKEDKLKLSDYESKVLQLQARLSNLNGLLMKERNEKELIVMEKEQLAINNKDLQEKITHLESTNKKILADLKMIKQFISKEITSPQAAGKLGEEFQHINENDAVKPEGSPVSRVDSYQQINTDEMLAKETMVDIVLCGPTGSGKSRLIEMALISNADEENLSKHRQFQKSKDSLTTFKMNVNYFKPEHDNNVLSLVEVPGEYIDDEETRKLMKNTYLIAVCFDPSSERSMIECITMIKIIMSYVQLRYTSIIMLQNDLILVEQSKIPTDLSLAQRFATENEILFVKVDNLFNFIKKTLPFIESKKSLRTILTTKKPVSARGMKGQKSITKSPIAFFYERFRSFLTGIGGSASQSKLLQATIIEHEANKLPPLGLKRVAHVSKYDSAVTCVTIRPEELTDPYVVVAVGRRNGTINIFHVYRTSLELTVLSNNLRDDEQLSSTLSSNEVVYDETTKIVDFVTLSLHTKAVTCMSFSRMNPNELVSISVDCTIRAWNVMTGELVKVFNDSYPGLCIYFHPLQPNLFFSCNSNPTLRIVDYNEGTVVQKIRTKSELRCLAFDDTRLNILAGSERGSITVYESQANMLLKVTLTKQISRGPVTCLSFVSPTSSDALPSLIANICSGSISVLNVIYDQNSGKIMELTHRYNVNNNHVALPLRSCYSKFGGGWCISGSEDRNILIFSLSDENIPFSISFHSGPVVSTAVNDNDTMMVSTDSKGVVAIWRRAMHIKN
ncbi:myosin [Theileria orientalis]|uniref:Myosin n=1 Tax=Theileria orientalis TaxID=68886 RepID=A0A976MAA0_THEOR|nr:myosin [Theileria orientalis]